MRHLVELFLFFTVLMVLPDWYIYRTYILRLKEQVWHRLYWLPSILLFICMLIAFIGYEPRPEAMNRLSLLLIVFLCINVPKALFALCALHSEAWQERYTMNSTKATSHWPLLCFRVLP